MGSTVYIYRIVQGLGYSGAKNCRIAYCSALPLHQHLLNAYFRVLDTSCLGLEGLSTDYVMPSKPLCVTGHYNLLTYVCVYVCENVGHAARNLSHAEMQQLCKLCEICGRKKTDWGIILDANLH